MIKKRLVIYSILVIFLSLNLVYAVCSDDSQRVLRISSSTNAHGENYTAGFYAATGQDICWTWGGPTIHTCNGENLILRLSDNTNAHAESPAGSTYTTQICYGDLVCSLKTSCDTSKGEHALLSLSAATNAHLALESDASYTQKVCCKVNVQLYSANWTNTINYLARSPGDVIYTTNKSKTVLMTVKGRNLDGQTITFQRQVRGLLGIWFNDGDPIEVVATSPDYAVAKWKVADENKNYTFTASINGLSLSKTSNELQTFPENPSIPPTVRITGTKDGGIYFLEENLTFNMSYVDADSTDLNFTWNFGDGTTLKGDTVSMENANPYHIFDKKGQMNVVLTMKDDRGAEGNYKISVLIINSSFALAGIAKPTWGEIISSTADNAVRFNATNTFIINSTENAGVRTITCIAGKCPSKTEGCPLESTAAFPACQVPIQGAPSPGAENWNNINFKWEIDNQYPYEQPGTKGVNPLPRYLESGKYTVKLTVNSVSNPSISGTDFMDFSVYLGQPFCIAGPNKAEWWFGSNSGNSWTANPAEYNCYNTQGDANGNHDCCPTGYYCEVSGTKGTCVRGIEARCEDFKTAGNCTGNNGKRIAEGQAQGSFGKTCGSSWINMTDECVYKLDNCHCEWNSTSNTCYGPLSDTTKRCGETLTNLGKMTLSTIEETNCTAGYKMVTWECSWSGSPSDRPKECPIDKQTTQIKCLSDAILGFFGLEGIILTLVLVTLFYVFTLKNKKK